MASSHKKRDLQKAHIFSNILRLIDDLHTFNNNEFENSYHDIYPDELELKKENEDPCKVSSLSLSMEVHDRKFTIMFTDKRDVFPFSKYAI